MKRNYEIKNGYIELIYEKEKGWKLPVQAYLRKIFHGKWETHRFFMEWNTFDEAILCLHKKHNYPIVINRNPVWEDGEWGK